MTSTDRFHPQSFDWDVLGSNRVVVYLTASFCTDTIDIWLLQHQQAIPASVFHFSLLFAY